MPPILIIDSHAVGHASKHSYGDLSDDSEPTGVIYGFLIKILSLAEKFHTNQFVFSWDSGKSFRKELYAGYKLRTEERTEEEILQDIQTRKQLITLRTEILPEMGFSNSYIQTGMEGDDIIASIVINNEGEKIILSDDKDLYQLLDHCSIFKLKTKVMYTRKSLIQEWGCDPQDWIEVKMYAGCTGDKVPNIPGVKEKTAIKFLKGELKGVRLSSIQHMIQCDKAFLERNRRLTCLPFEGTKPIKLQEFKPLDYFAIQRICAYYGLRSLLKNKYLTIWHKLCERR